MTGSEPSLVEWLSACVDDDARSAQECIDAVGAHRADEMYDDGSGIASRAAFPSYPWVSDAEAELDFMAGPGHPARVLAEVAAKRRIIEQYREALRAKDWPACSALEEVLPVLALPYAGRDGYRDEWKPE